MEQYFPLGLAVGDAFCNRVKERQWIADNIKNTRHSLLISPRRYGKTSLANQVLVENHYESAKFDLLLVSDDMSVQQEILEQVGLLIGKLMPLQVKAFEVVKKFLGTLKPEISINENGPKITFTPSTPPKKSIIEVLLQLDKLAAYQDKKVVLFLDEFQQIGTIKDHKIIEAAIRHAAERAQNTSYIFSGSNRHLLLEMFQDNLRPLFHLCEEIRISRMQAEDYRPYMQHAAQKQWQAELAEASFMEILTLTKRHPYYINLLCSRLWREQSPPGVELIHHVWESYCQEQRSRVSGGLSSLSPNQRAVVRSIAKHPTQQPMSAHFQQYTGLSTASLAQSLKVLRDKDIIYEDDDGYHRLLDPVIESLYS